MIFKADKRHVRIGGRILEKDGICYIDYTNSFVEFEFEGSRADVVLVTSDEEIRNVNPAWLAVFVNDGTEPSMRFALKEKRQRVCIYSSDTVQRVKLRLSKMSEAAFGKAGIESIETDGELLPPPLPRSQRRIEFVGDSITCGYGTRGVFNVDTFSTDTEDPLLGYAWKTAQKLGSEYQYVSWSGIGVLSAWVEETAEKPLDNWLLKDIYPYTDSPLERECGMEKADFTPYDFSFDPQVIVFFDGTNDHSWTKGIAEREEDFARAYYDMLECIRKNNPNAYIVTTYGIMGTSLSDTIAAAVEKFRAEHDDMIVYVPLEVQDEENDGVVTDWHPSEKSHEKIACRLAQVIEPVFTKLGL